MLSILDQSSPLPSRREWLRLGGLGAVGAGVGIGIIFGKVIESVTRQPEMRDEITGIQWLGFALTEAVFFYGLVAGLLAFVL